MFFDDHFSRFKLNIESFYCNVFNQEYFDQFFSNVSDIFNSAVKSDCSSSTDYYFRVTLIPSFNQFEIDENFDLYAQIYLNKLATKSATQLKS